MEQLLTWLKGNADVLTIAGLMGGIVFCCVYPIIFFAPKREIPNGVKIMVKKAEWAKEDMARRLQERQHVIDMFEDGLLKLYAEGKLSSTGYTNWHDRFAQWLNVVDVLNGKITDPKLVKERLKKARNGGTYYGIYLRKNIPGPKPGEQEVVVNKLQALLLSLQPK